MKEGKLNTNIKDRVVTPKEEVLPPPSAINQKIILELSNDDAKKILHCLMRTNARNNNSGLTNILDVCERVEKELYEKISW